METSYRILRAGHDEPEPRSCELPDEPGYDRLSALIDPILRVHRSGAHLEHVSVLDNGKPADMFVDDMGAICGLPVNWAATRIYHASCIRRGYRHTDGIAIDAPLIYGTAIVFDRRVWF